MRTRIGRKKILVNCFSTMIMTRYFLGLDWGKSKIGTALADDETRMAFAHSIIGNDGSVLTALKKIIADHDVETVVVGVPSTYAHTEDLGSAAREFGDRVARECGVKVEFFHEMFTTKMAQSNLAESGRRGELDDQEAARLILQEWLDK